MPPQTLDTFVAPRYRSAGRRKDANNDRRAAADAPLAALRGFLSGVAGAPGDIESLVRMLPGLNEETVLPTSDDLEKMLPLRSVSATPVGRAATGAAQLGGGFYVGPGSPLRAIAAAPRAVSKASRDFAAAAGGSGSNVVKNRGGNWLAGSVEGALRGLSNNQIEQAEYNYFNRLQAEEGGAFQDWLQQRWAQDDQYRKKPGFVAANEFLAEKGLPPLQVRGQDAALNTWIDKQLTRYVKNDMATPEDPIRALIQERGVSHTPLDELIEGSGWVPEDVARQRVLGGFPEQGSAEALHAQRGFPEGLAEDRARAASGWEVAADSAVRARNAGDLFQEEHLANNPWLAKVPPSTPVYSSDLQYADLGFSHLIDELRNATNPQSGLPRELLLKYESLPQLSVPQAVERVAKINEWRAAQKVAADAARANNAATQVFKEYPDKGFKWVELTSPKPELGSLKSEYVPEVDMWRIVDDRGGVVSSGATEKEALGLLNRKEREAMLEDALKYEGEVMGHCVGGYCPDVLEGRSRIYSLRDAKGQPHVTVEVRPQKTGQWLDSIPEEEYQRLAQQYKQETSSPSLIGFPSWASKFAPSEQAIIQIKGKANRAPNEEYLPYVQDFVKSGRWSEVGDLKNTGLVDIQEPNALFRALRDVSPERDIDKAIQRFNAAVESNPSAQRYMRKEELRNFLDDELARNLGLDAAPPKGFAAGGLVSSNDYDPFAVDALVEQLRAEFA